MTAWKKVWNVVRPALKPVVATVVACAALSAVGRYMGPQWKPTELNRDITPESPDVLIGSPDSPPVVGTYEVAHSDEVLVLPGGQDVKVRITYPVGAQEPQPGVVFMHGAGTHTHDKAFAQQAQDFASAGIFSIIPERGAATYSTTERDYHAMAEDYQAAWEYLRSWPGVDPARIGLYAESEGAWIAPIIAAENPEVDFVVLASAPVVPAREQFALAADTYLRNTGVPEQVNRMIPRLMGGAIPGEFSYVDFNASPFTQQMQQPVLMVYGTGDTSMPLIQGPLTVQADLAAADNHQWMLRYFEGANHGLKIDDELAPGFSESVSRWILDPQGALATSPAVAGATPEQRFIAEQPDTPRWFADGWLKVLMPAVPVVMIGAGLAIDAYQRRRGMAPIPGPYRLAAGVGLAQMAGLAVYIRQVADLALNYRVNDAVTQLGWYGLQFVALTGLAIYVYSFQSGQASAVRNKGEGPVSGFPVGFVLTQAGTLLVLVYGAYWGLYPLFDR